MNFESGTPIDPAEFATAVDTLRGTLRGETLTEGDDGYDDARAVWNAMIDRRPLLIARCKGVADVIGAIGNRHVGIRAGVATARDVLDFESFDDTAVVRVGGDVQQLCPGIVRSRRPVLAAPQRWAEVGDLTGRGLMRWIVARPPGHRIAHCGVHRRRRGGGVSPGGAAVHGRWG